MNRAAQALGRRAKGVPKNYSADELERRKQLLATARAKRWENHKKKSK
jgi:hypothetical protein